MSSTQRSSTDHPCRGKVQNFSTMIFLFSNKSISFDIGIWWRWTSLETPTRSVNFLSVVNTGKARCVFNKVCRWRSESSGGKKITWAGVEGGLGGCGGERHAGGPYTRPGDVGQGGRRHCLLALNSSSAKRITSGLTNSWAEQACHSQSWLRVERATNGCGLSNMQKRYNHYSGFTRRGNLRRGATAVSLDACCPPKRRGPNSASGCRYLSQSLYTTSFRFMWTVAVFCPPFGVVSQIPEFSFLSRKIKSRKLFQWDVIGGWTL